MTNYAENKQTAVWWGYGILLFLLNTINLIRGSILVGVYESNKMLLSNAKFAMTEITSAPETILAGVQDFYNTYPGTGIYLSRDGWVMVSGADILTLLNDGLVFEILALIVMPAIVLVWGKKSERELEQIRGVQSLNWVLSATLTIWKLSVVVWVGVVTGIIGLGISLIIILAYSVYENYQGLKQFFVKYEK